METSNSMTMTPKKGGIVLKVFSYLLDVYIEADFRSGTKPGKTAGGSDDQFENVTKKG